MTFHTKTIYKILKAFRMHDWFFLGLVVVSLFFKLYNFPARYPLWHNDPGWDYIVMDHMVRYSELPITGPLNDIYKSALNSPFYYYFFAPFLLIKNNPIFLGYVNVFLQLITVSSFYLLARFAFGGETAIIASLFFVFHRLIWDQSAMLWLPHSIQPFIYSGYLLLFLSFSRKNYPLLLVSVFLMMTSLGFGLYTVGVLPVYFLCVFITLKKLRVPPAYTAGILGVITASLFINFLGPVILLLRNADLQQMMRVSVYTSSPIIYVQSLLANLHLFLSQILTPYEMLNHILYGIALISFAAALILYMGSKTKSISKKFILLTLLFIIQTIFITSFYTGKVNYWFFSTVFGLFFLVIAEIISRTIPSKPVGMMILKLGVIFFLVKIISVDFVFIHVLNSPKESPFSPVANTIIREVKTIQTNESRDTPNFFLFKIFLDNQEHSAFDAGYWVAMERAFNVKLTTVVSSGNNYITNNTDEYIFLLCIHSDLYKPEYLIQCRSTFEEQFRFHTILRKIYDDGSYVIYVTKKSV